MEIKDLIKQRREELGLTFEALGNLVGVGKSTVRKWETGMIENMRRDNIIALSKALNISPSILMGWEEIKEEKTSNLSTKEDKLLHKFNKLNDIGKNEAIKRVEELTFLSKYSNTNNEYGFNTIAAHNDFVHDENERNLIKQDLEDMDNW